MNYPSDIYILVWVAIMLLVVLPIAVIIQLRGKTVHDVKKRTLYALVFSTVSGGILLVPVVYLTLFL